jgi:hypothetical protein
MFGMPHLRYTVTGFSEPAVDPLNKFALEGEGGYQEWAYTFVDKGSAFFDDRERTGYINGIISDTRLIKSTTINGDLYYFIQNVLKVASGNLNKVIIYRDGGIDIGGTRSNFPWIAANLEKIADIFCPSNYTANYKQLFLLKNGELYEVDCLNKTTNLLLTNVDRFLAKNPAHNCDILLSTYNGDIYHAWVVNSGGGYTSGHATGVSKVVGVNVLDLSFATIGDNPWAALVCYKADKTKIYRLTASGGKKIGVESTPYFTLTDPTEYYIHGMSNEFNTVLITNKKLYNYLDRGWYADYYTLKTYDFTNGIRICTPTAYSMMIEATDGYHFMDLGTTGGGRGNYDMLAPVPFSFYNKLKAYLLPFRTL